MRGEDSQARIGLMRCMPAEGARLPVPVTLRGELGVCWLCVLNVRVQRNGVCVGGGDVVSSESLSVGELCQGHEHPLLRM